MHRPHISLVAALSLLAGACAKGPIDTREAVGADATAEGSDLGLPATRAARPLPPPHPTPGPDATAPMGERAQGPAGRDEATELALDLPSGRSRRVGTGTVAAAPRPARVAPDGPVDLVRVVVGTQRLELWAGESLVRSYAVSTAKNGVGSEAGSQRTPLGRHRVHAKFGAGEPVGRVFESRRPTGTVATIHTAPVDLPEDVITSRILWLEGLEPGKNRGKGVDSKDRYIYIHGTNEEGLIGTPASHGCVRMRNADVLEVFERVAEGTTVEIVP